MLPCFVHNVNLVENKKDTNHSVCVVSDFTFWQQTKDINISRRIQLHLLYKDKTAQDNWSDFHFQVKKNEFDIWIYLLDSMNSNHNGIKKKKNLHIHLLKSGKIFFSIKDWINA